MGFTLRFTLENVPDSLKMRLYDKKRCKYFYDFSIKYNKRDKPELELDLDKEDYITIETDDLEMKESEASDLVLQRSTGIYDNVGNLLYEDDYVHLSGYGVYHIEYPYKELYEYEILTKATKIVHLKKFAEFIKPLKWYDINIKSLLSEATTAISEYSLECVSEKQNIVSIQKYDRVTETSSTLRLCESVLQAKEFCWWDYVEDMSEYLIEPQPFKKMVDKYAEDMLKRDVRKGSWADASWGLWEKKDEHGKHKKHR